MAIKPSDHVLPLRSPDTEILNAETIWKAELSTYKSRTPLYAKNSHEGETSSMRKMKILAGYVHWQWGLLVLDTGTACRLPFATKTGTCPLSPFKTFGTGTSWLLESASTRSVETI
jgi:hypothetical protein